MERVVYLLGAGFSAPLGLPVMSNFLEKSKDMYFENPDRYQYFSDVFNQIRDFSVVKNYYDSDLFNIEEILSILEMASQLEGKRLKKNFIKYLSDVIEYYTPQIIPYQEPLPSNWERVIFSDARIQNNFGIFYAAIQNLRIEAQMVDYHNRRLRRCRIERCKNPAARYALITLNYDRVLEKFAEYPYSHIPLPRNQPPFVSEFGDKIQPFSQGAIIAKLHGSVGLENIVPPTWSKGVDRKILAAWRIAYQALVEATQIRIIGYSLPEADAYVKYLLKAAVRKAPHLKRLDVLCLDPDGTVRRRYDAFIEFPLYRFRNDSVTNYLELHIKNHYTIRKEGGGKYSRLTSLKKHTPGFLNQSNAFLLSFPSCTWERIIDPSLV
jgi:hypothetical protein